MPKHSFESLQARLNQSVDASEAGQTLPQTAAALTLQDPAQRLVTLVEALENERLLVPAVVEGGACEKGEVSVTQTKQWPAVVAFTSADAMNEWDADARPVPMPARRVAMLAVAQTSGRLVIDKGRSDIRIPRPATVALAHGDRWLPAWQDGELLEELAGRLTPRIAFVKPLPSAGATLRLAVGILQGASKESLTRDLQQIAATPRLRPAAELVEIVPTVVAQA